MAEIARLMVAFGAVAATVGLVVLGMGMSYIYPDPNSTTLGLVIMIAGLVLLAAGLVILRVAGEPDRARR